MRFPLEISALGMAFAFAVSAAIAPAFAQDAGAGGGDRAEKFRARFAAADKNGDGKLSKDEAKAGMPFIYKRFDEIDKGHTGSVTMADIALYAKQMRAAKQPGG